MFRSLCVLEIYEVLIDTKFEDHNHKGDRGKMSKMGLKGTQIG